MPPATYSSTPTASTPTFDEVYETYWAAKRRYEDLEFSLTSTASPSERLNIQREMETLEHDILRVEEGAKVKGYYARLVKRPTTFARAGSSYSARDSSSVSRQSLASLRASVAKTQYEGGAPYYRGSAYNSPAPKEESVKISTREGGGPFRQLKEVPPYTAGLARATTEVAELETEYFRDSHHGPGALRTVTKAGWTAGAVGLQAFAGVIASQIMGGHVPFDFFPNLDDEDDEWDDD